MKVTELKKTFETNSDFYSQFIIDK